MDKTINDILEENNITLSKFASDFAMSRNTVSQYIKLYEENKKIPKEKYEIIFNKLFKNYDSDTFRILYFSFKRLINRDKLNGTLDLSTNKTDKLMRLFKDINDAFKDDLINDQVFYLMGVIVKNYSRDGLIKSFCDYFYFFNKCEPEDYDNLSEDDKKCYINYFKIFTMQSRGLLNLDKEMEELFLSRMREISKLRKMSENK